MIAALALYIAFTLGWWAAEPDHDAIASCLYEQVAIYGDLCAESSSGYEDMSGSEAHFEGVKCAAEASRICAEVSR